MEVHKYENFGDGAAKLLWEFINQKSAGIVAQWVSLNIITFQFLKYALSPPTHLCDMNIEWRRNFILRGRSVYNPTSGDSPKAETLYPQSKFVRKLISLPVSRFGPLDWN